MAGPVSPLHFPVLWAQDPGLSHLRPPGEVRALLHATGFKELAWIDETAPALRWHQKRLAATPGDPSPLGPQLVFRHDFEEMLRNQVLNLSEDRIVVIQSLFERQERMLLLRIIPNKIGFTAPLVLQARPLHTLMTKACSRRLSGRVASQERA